MEGCTERTEIFGMVWKPVPSVPKRSVGYIPAEIPAVYLGTYRTEHTLAKFDFTVDEGKEWLNPSRDKNQGTHRRRKVD